MQFTVNVETGYKKTDLKFAFLPTKLSNNSYLFLNFYKVDYISANKFIGKSYFTIWVPINIYKPKNWLKIWPSPSLK